MKKGNWAYNMKNLELTLKQLKESGIKCNIEEYLFGKNEM